MKNNIAQKIKGNDNIQQKIENQTVNIYSEGISEQKVREISENNARSIAQEYFIAAQDLADRRMANFENIVIQRLEKLNDKFACFQDPSFNLSYRQAQIQAATTDDSNSYKILSELLVHRHKKTDDKISQTGINGAIAIVEQLSDSTLTALTILSCIVIGVRPFSESISDCLQKLEELYSSIIVDKLPHGENWIEQLDILNAIRIKDFAKLKPFEDIISEQYNGLVCVGIKEDSEDFKTAIKFQTQIGVKILTPNELKEGYYRLPIVTKQDINSLSKIINGFEVPLNEDEKENLNKIFNLYETSVDLVKEVKKKFFNRFDSYPNLKQIHSWWNSLTTSFNLTTIGRVLGHANAQNRFPGFPPLD